MESRKLKRYDSAPISTGTAAARAAAHISNTSRPLPSPPPASASSSSSAKPVFNAATPSSVSNAMSASDSSPETYEKRLEAYYRCMEEDNQTLMNYYEAHTMDIASLKVLAQERKYKDTVYQAMEAKTAAMDAFLQEMVDLTAPSRALLRSRGDANTRGDTAKNASVKSSKTTKEGKATAAAPAVTPAASMDSVRDAVQQLQASLQAVSAKEQKHTLTIQALEKEVAEWKEKARARNYRNNGGDENDDNGSYFLPGTAKELRESQRRVRELERRLTATTAEAKDAAAAVAKLEQQQRVAEQTLQRREDELAAMRGLLSTKEQLLWALEEEAKTTRTSMATPRTGGGGGARYTRTNSAPAGSNHSGSGAAGPSSQQQHRFGGETSSDRLVVTHHYRLFGGQRFVDGHEFSAESFKDAFLRSVSTLLRIPYGYLTSVEVRTHAEAVSVELDIRHSFRMKEDEIDFLLLSHNYPEVAAFLEKMQAEVASKKPKDRYAVRVQELQTTLTEKEQENAKLRRRLRAMEESLERRDNDRAVLDKDVDAALQETAGTVQDLYEALQAAQQDTEAAHKALAVRTSQTRALEQAKEAALEAAAAAERAYQQEIAKLNEQLAQAQADVSKAKESVTQAMLQAQSEEKAEPRVALFSFVVPLATASAQRAAAAVLKDSQQTRVLHALALAYAGRTGGAIPVQVKSCVVSDDGAASSSSIPPAVLQITVELAYYANARTADAAQAEVGRKLQEGGSCTSVQEYLRMRSEAARREATAAADAQRAVSEADQRAAAAIAAMRAESQRTSETKPEAAASQLQEINAKVASVVVPPSSSSSSSDSGKATASVVGRVDQLIIRLTTAEAAARRYEEEKQHASRRLAEAQQEREQLQQTLTELTTRCTEVRVAKEQLASRLACAEEQLKAAQAAAGESQSVLSERVKRLESALRAKTAAAEAEKEAAADGLKAAVAAAAAERVAESEEMLKAKEREIQRLQTKLAAATAAAASLSKASSGDEAALREALKTAKEDRTALARQVKEMETDMNDLSNIQAAMQRELESAQQELRAKKHDFDLLVKQLIRMEEREKKWQLESHTQQQQQPNSPDSPSRQQQQSEEAEKDDVARESLVVLTNSNKSLQQCLRKLQRTMHSMGMAVRLSSSAAAAAGGAASFSSTMEGNDSGRGTRRSGHRKGALAATVSRAANDHHQLSAQLSELLLAMLDELETGKNQHHQARSSGNDDASNSATRGVKTNIGPTGSGAAFTRTASYHCNPHHQQTSSGAGAASRIVKQHLSNSPFARTRSTPVLVERVSQGTNDPSTPQHTSKPETRDVDVAAAAASSGVKATVDAAPRLEFFRQTSSRAYTRSNTTATAVAAALTDGSDNTNGAALLPTSAAASSSGGAEKEQEKERRSREQPQRRTGSGASTSGVSHVNAARRHAPSSTTTTTTKSNPFRRSNTATAGTSGGSSAASAAAMNSSSAAAASGNANFVRMPSGYRCMPTNTAEAGASTHKPYRMRF